MYIFEKPGSTKALIRDDMYVVSYHSPDDKMWANIYLRGPGKNDDVFMSVSVVDKIVVVVAVHA